MTNSELFDRLITDCPLEEGQAYLFRCVTYHYIGTVVKVGPFEIVLKDAVWVADSGNFQGALEKGTISDAMHYPVGAPVILGRLSIVDATPWVHPLPAKR